MIKKRLLFAVSLLLTAVMLFGCGNTVSNTDADTKSGITFINTSKEEYDTLSLIVRSYFAAADGYDYSDYGTTVADRYIVSDTKQTPVELSWSYGENDCVAEARVYLSQSESFENASVFDVTENKLTLTNLFTGTRYYWYIEATNESCKEKSEIFSFTVLPGVRLVSIDGVQNCRDMGGWQTLDGKTVKQGLAYRTSRLSGINDKNILVTEKGIDTAVNELKIKTELDLRTAAEMRDGVVPDFGELGEKVNFINLSAPSYEAFYGSETAKKELLLFADIDNYPILFHCAAGMDRTGTLSFMIKAMLGVSEQDLVKDHELSFGRTRNDTTYKFGKLVELLKNYKGDTLAEKAHYCMVHSIGLSEMAVSNIYNIFMTDGAIFDASSLEIPKAVDGKVTFNLIMRSSVSVSSLKIEDQDAEYSLDGNVLTLTVPQDVKKGKLTGVITFDDGTSLTFNCK